jgi:hypothetical protein
MPWPTSVQEEQANGWGLSYNTLFPMKAYLITTGTVFGLITLAHLSRVYVEGPRLAKEPGFVLLTFLAAALSFWAWRLLPRLSRP